MYVIRFSRLYKQNAPRNLSVFICRDLLNFLSKFIKKIMESEIYKNIAQTLIFKFAHLLHIDVVLLLIKARLSRTIFVCAFYLHSPET